MVHYENCIFWGGPGFLGDGFTVEKDGFLSPRQARQARFAALSQQAA